MASTTHVIVVDGSTHLLADAECHLIHLEQRWSRFVPDSDITRLNLAGGRPVTVHPDTQTLLATMVQAWRITGGRFNPTVLPGLVAAGYAASIADPALVTALPVGRLDVADLACLDIDPLAGTAALAPGVVLDPGGIGKGLAADLTVAMLLAGGARGALVGVGGDLAMAGDPPDPGGWRVTVERPEPDDSDLCTLAVSGGGVATSTTVSRRWMQNGRASHHVIDPVSLRPSDTDLAAVTVFARSGWLAEAHATAALLCGRDAVVAYLHDHQLSGIAVSLDRAHAVTDDLACLVRGGGDGRR